MLKGDTTPEPDETFTVTISAPTGALLGRTVATGKIIDDDPPQPGRRVAIGDAGIEEGAYQSRDVRLTVSLSTAVSAATTVHYATSDGTATSVSDYAAASGTATILANERATAIVIHVNGDTTIEGDQRFTVTISAPSAGILGRHVGTVTIYNDD